MKLTLLSKEEACRLYEKEPAIIPDIKNIGQTAYVQYVKGCPRYSSCNFCGFYTDRHFSRKSFAELENHIESVVKFHQQKKHTIKRVFLGDGDAFSLRRTDSESGRNSLFEDQILILRKINTRFPPYFRNNTALGTFYGDIYVNEPVSTITPVSISSFISTVTILTQNNNLSRLRKEGLESVYWGIESGSNQILKKLNKIANVNTLIRCAEYLHKAGIRFSAIILTGVFGKEYSENHIQETAALLNIIQPDAVSFSDIVTHAGSGYHTCQRDGTFTALPEYQLKEQRERIIDKIAATDVFIEDYTVETYK